MYPLNARLGGPRGGLDVLEKRKILTLDHSAGGIVYTAHGTPTPKISP